MNTFLLLFTLLLVIPKSAFSYNESNFKIEGILRCKGTPTRGTILMVDDNLDHWDHLLDEVEVSDDGVFVLYGWLPDECLHVKLFVEHGCTIERNDEESRTTRDIYSEYSIASKHLETHNHDWTFSFELVYMVAERSWPKFSIYRYWLHVKQTEMYKNVERLFGKHTWKTRPIGKCLKTTNSNGKRFNFLFIFLVLVFFHFVFFK